MGWWGWWWVVKGVSGSVWVVSCDKSGEIGGVCWLVGGGLWVIGCEMGGG